MMKVPNWQHHSKKEKKRVLKPQALRSARERRRQLIKRLLKTSTKGGFFINKNKNVFKTPESEVEERKVYLVA